MDETPRTPARYTANNKRRYTTSPSPKITRQNNSANILNGSGHKSQIGTVNRLSLDGQRLSSLPTSSSRISRANPGLTGGENTIRTPVNYSSKNNTNSNSNTGGSHLSTFYKEQAKELHDLQETLYNKKAKLDELRDIVNNGQNEFNETKLKWEELKDLKISKEQQLKLKENEMEKLKETNEARRNFLEEGHNLHLQQLEVEHQTKINKLVNEYNEKIENLKKVKIKKFEDERNDLAKEVESIKSKISNNDMTLDSMIKEVRDKYDTLKEEWLKEYQIKWKENLELNETYSNEINELNKEIHEELEPKRDANQLKLKQLREKHRDLKKILQDRREEKIKLETNIKSKELQIEENNIKQKELKDYIEKTEFDLKEIVEILTKEETLRRSLHNDLQELRGNIRVFCRIRPTLPGIENSDTSHILVDKFDDDHGIQTMELVKQSNGSSNITQHYQFDKIFNVGEDNNEVFKEVGQLVQSSLDGYNVCIFAYGQTGSGKTFTMLNPGDGIIPLTISHIFDWIESLKERGWEYNIECQFVEIYNENIVDLLRNESTTHHEDQTSQHSKCEIRHDIETETTSITNVTTCTLDSKETVSNILKKANKLRSTASTQSNEHSSRSHSIFIIHLYGHNDTTNEKSHGILNLVDLAGSERIHSSQVTGDRLRETQNINKSLSCLGDVIHALNTPDKNGKRHIPFRNSKLTYLLQYSLLGNSKTLMFVNISPSSSHINETVNSLRFASKVNSTKMVK